jgi:GTP-binding protein
MFVDSVTVKLSAGKGGNGVVAWRREKFIPKGGPAGGNGGRGGSIILQTDTQVVSLESLRNRRLINADNGLPGSSNNKQGATGKDLIIKIPCGTLVKNAETGEVIFDFTEDKQTWKICEGGKGGKGNSCFKSPTHQAPNICTEGTYGQSVEVELELKLIADVGLIGIPNAGKSTLMSKMTDIEVKIGAYPFTTLHPNLSYIQFEDYSRVLVADIPGIIEDAHADKGLGLAFLKHIERSALLLYVIDVSGFEGRDPYGDFEILRKEIASYRADLMEKPFLVALNKTDMEGAAEHVQSFKERYPFNPATLFEISAAEELGLEPLVEALRKTVQKNGKHF